MPNHIKSLCFLNFSYSNFMIIVTPITIIFYFSFIFFMVKSNMIIFFNIFFSVLNIFRVSIRALVFLPPQVIFFFDSVVASNNILNA